MIPPILLITRTIFHLELSRARGVLLVPKWPSAPFWPVLFPLGGPRGCLIQFICLNSPILHLFSRRLVQATILSFALLDLNLRFWFYVWMVHVFLVRFLVSSFVSFIFYIWEENFVFALYSVIACF